MIAPDFSSLVLTGYERKVMDALIAGEGEVVTKATLTILTGSPERRADSTSNPQEVLICRLRKKLMAAGLPHKILNVRGQGWRLVDGGAA